MKALVKGLLQTGIILISLFSITACELLDSKDNVEPPTPLKAVKPKVAVQQRWQVSTGNGSGGEYFKLNPAYGDGKLFLANQNGYLTAVNANTGQVAWKTNTDSELSSGVAVSDDKAFVGSNDGKLLALQKDTGKILWRKQMVSQILATPVVSDKLVIVKTVDGAVNGVNMADGKLIWRYRQHQPLFILRSTGGPAVKHGLVVLGFPNGSVAALDAKNGHPVWKQMLAEPKIGGSIVQQLVDVDATPVIVGDTVYLASYQGKMAALDLFTGKPLWQENVSSYAGLAVNEQNVNVVASNSDIVSFKRNTGKKIWQQNDLQARVITTPAEQGKYLIVADGYGYLHWISELDGSVAARAKLSSHAIVSTPIIVNNMVYAVDNKGVLAAYSIG